MRRISDITRWDYLRLKIKVMMQDKNHNPEIFLNTIKEKIRLEINLLSSKQISYSLLMLRDTGIKNFSEKTSTFSRLINRISQI